MNSLLFIRHAETDLAGTFCGHADPPINARGEQQIDDLVKRIANRRVDAIYSSDLRRAAATARALAHAKGAVLTTSPALREIHFGEWEALTWNDIERRDPAYARRWADAFPHLPAPGGESFADFEARVQSQLDDLLLLAQHKRVVVVTHAGVMRLVLRLCCGYTDKQAWAQNIPYCGTFATNHVTMKDNFAPHLSQEKPHEHRNQDR